MLDHHVLFPVTAFYLVTHEYNEYQQGVNRVSISVHDKVQISLFSTEQRTRSVLMHFQIGTANIGLNCPRLRLEWIKIGRHHPNH